MAASMIIHVRFDLFGGGSSVQSSFEDVSSQNVIDSRSHGVGGGQCPILAYTSVSSGVGGAPGPEARPTIEGHMKTSICGFKCIIS